MPQTRAPVGLLRCRRQGIAPEISVLTIAYKIDDRDRSRRFALAQFEGRACRRGLPTAAFYQASALRLSLVEASSSDSDRREIARD